ncbi:hypothetical protein [Rhodopseudomonas pseudopalustris]|uniref:hypothetical protein n=1 Tax=Rhodopseudomonas pseudopalustris TaxID=1513892 RepID=UPI003F994337
MVMPPQFIIIGMPLPIMVIMVWQHCMNMSFIAGSIGAISQVIMPFGAMLQVILHIIIGIGIAIPGMAMPGIIIGMPPIMGFIITGFIIGFMPPIIGIMGIICIAVFMALSIIGDELFFVGVD